MRALRYEPINTVYFSDVPLNHWTAGYVGATYNNKIINGMGDGTFSPDTSATYGQAAKMIVSAYGYEIEAMQLGGYPIGYLVIASREGFTSGVAGIMDQPITRAEAARLIYNAMTANE